MVTDFNFQTVFQIIFVTFFLWLFLRSSNEKSYPEPLTRESEKEKSVREELEAVQKISSNPNRKFEPIEQLLELYSWKSLLNLIGIGGLSIQLIEQVYLQPGIIILPNMQLKNFGQLEMEVHNKVKQKIHAAAKRTFSSPYDLVDSFSYEDEITTTTLEYLKSSNLINCECIDAQFRRNYEVSLTNTGFSLLVLNKRFSGFKDYSNVPHFYGPSSPEIASIVKTLMYTALNLDYKNT